MTVLCNAYVFNILNEKVYLGSGFIQDSRSIM